MDIDFRDMTRQFLQGTVAEEDTGEAGLLNEAKPEQMEEASSWRDPINLPSGDELEASGREGIASYHDMQSEALVVEDLAEYIEYNFKATLSDAVNAWLEAHGFDDPPLSAGRESQREFLMKVGRKHGLGGLNEDKYWDERRRTYVPVEDWSPKKLGSSAMAKDVTLVGIVEKVRDLLEKSGNQEALGHIEAALESIRGRANDSVGE